LSDRVGLRRRRARRRSWLDVATRWRNSI